MEEHLYAGRGVRAVYPPEKIGRGFDIGDGRYGKQARNFTIETKKLLRQQHILHCNPSVQANCDNVRIKDEQNLYH